MLCRNCQSFLMPGKMMCLKCGDWTPNSADTVGGASANDPVKEDDFMDAFDVEAVSLERIITGTLCDECWGGGFVPSSITLLGGPPGGGKTSLLIYLAKSFAAYTKKPAYLISAEQDKGEIKIALNRFWPDLQPGMMRVLKKMGAGGTLDEAALNKAPPGMLILDSISALCGNDKHAQIQVGKRYKQYAVKYKAPTFIIAHMTKESDFAGLMTLQHDVDVLVTVFPEEDGSRTIKAWKNRFGPTHKEYKLILTEHGYEAPPPIPEKGKRRAAPPPVELLPHDGPSSPIPALVGPTGERLATVTPINKFKRPTPDAEAPREKSETAPAPDEIAGPTGQRLVRMKKKGDTKLLKAPLTATVKEVTGAKGRKVSKIASKSKAAQAAAIEGEALKRRRPPMPKTRDAKVKAERSTRKMKKPKGKAKSEESRV